MLHNFEELRTAIIWKSSEKSIRICSLEVSHIQNIIITLTQKQESCNNLGLGHYEYQGKNASEWIEILKEELLFRRKVKPDKNHAITL